MPAVSPTVWLPVLRVSSPVDAAVTDVGGVAVGGAVDLEVEQARVGARAEVLATSSLPVSRVLVIVQTMSAPVVTVTFSGPPSSPAVATTAPVPLSALHSIDFW